jgi:uncharacterized membrane protein YhdT
VSHRYRAFAQRAPGRRDGHLKFGRLFILVCFPIAGLCIFVCHSFVKFIYPSYDSSPEGKCQATKEKSRNNFSF